VTKEGFSKDPKLLFQRATNYHISNTPM